MSFLEELKRRNVVRVAAAYLALAWLVVQIVETLFPMYGVSDAVARTVVTLVGLGLIPVVILAWVFELTPEGIRRDTEVDHESAAAQRAGRNLDRAFIVLLALGITYFAVDKFVLDPERDEAELEAARQEGRAAAAIETYGDKSIAVLPFVNMSSDPEQEYFADGISEELLNLLAQIPELRVISRSSAFSFKGKDVDIPTVARQLNVAHVLEGSVRKSGNTIRITAQLIEASTDRHLWSETYDRTLDDIFAIQDEVAAHVVEELRLNLLDGPPTVKVMDPAAYTLFLQARSIVTLEDRERFEVAESLLEDVLEVEPEHVESMMLLDYVRIGWHEIQPATLEQVLAIEPDNQVALSFKAVSAINDFQVAVAARLIQRAVSRPSTHPIVWLNAAVVAVSIGRLDAAIEISEYVVVRDPLLVWAHLNFADYLTHAGRMEEAIRRYELAIGLNETAGVVQWKYGLALLMAGRPEEALAAFEREPGPLYALHGRALALHDLGRLDESAAALERLTEDDAADWPFGLARAHAWLGNADQAFHYLERTLAEAPGYLGGIATHPLFAPVHDDPRWLPFVEKAGQSAEQLAAIEFDLELPGT
jgi:TolB-like protein/Flp pilus assembly protein TadD